MTVQREAFHHYLIIAQKSVSRMDTHELYIYIPTLWMMIHLDISWMLRLEISYGWTLTGFTEY